jgi:hypothetical protein
VVSLKIDRNLLEANDALDELKGGDLSELCRMFELSVGGSLVERITRLLAMGERSYTRLIRVSRQVYFGYCAEDHVSTREMKIVAQELGVPASGSKHEMFMNAVIKDKSPVPKMLAIMDIADVRKVYKCLFDRHPIDSESVLKEEIQRWLNFEPYKEEIEMAKPTTYAGASLPTIVRQTDESFLEASSSANAGSSVPSPLVLVRNDVAISYAGEDETVAHEIAEAMKGVGLRVFFAPFEQANLWGKKLSDAFRESFGSKATYVLVLVSKHYALKDFTNFEFTIARDEARKRKEEFILPVRLDNTPIIGLHSDVAYIEYSKVGAKEVARLVRQKMLARSPIIPRLKPTRIQWPSLVRDKR